MSQVTSQAAPRSCPLSNSALLSVGCSSPRNREKLTELVSRHLHLLPLEAWAKVFLPEYFPRPASSFHRWLFQKLTTLHQKRGSRLAVVAPRGNAKSTCAALAYPLRAAVEKWEPYIQLVSD